MPEPDWIVAAICAVAIACVIARPFGWPEWIWAVAGAAALVLGGLLPPGRALAGIRQGSDVYLFLVGMMLLAEIARAGGLFDWLAAWAARAARGSSRRLFVLLYGVGTVVTVFLSNDATAVVLTPAVAAVVRAAKACDPLPFLYICAFVANAASFVLPISNPANLVIYGAGMPALLAWLPRYALPSALATAATFAALYWTQRRALRAPLARDVVVPALSAAGRLAAIGLGLTACVLLAASALGWDLGLPTFVAGALTCAVVIGWARLPLWTVLRHVAWGVLPLVAGLFVMVEALTGTGLIARLGAAMRALNAASPGNAAWAVGIGTALVSNLVNNLPAGLIAGRVTGGGDVSEAVRAAVLIGIDLGPNLSVTGSLATLLWLGALRRDGHRVGAWQFLKIGAVVMTPALLLALGAVVLAG